MQLVCTPSFDVCTSKEVLEPTRNSCKVSK